jgi:hypothetical protein
MLMILNLQTTGFNNHPLIVCTGTYDHEKIKTKFLILPKLSFGFDSIHDP